MLAAEVDAVLTVPPMVGPPGSTGPPAAPPAAVSRITRGPAPVSAGAETAPPQGASGPVLRALFREGHAAAPGRAGASRSAASRMRRPSVTVIDRWSTSRDVRLMAAPAPEEATGNQGIITATASPRMLWPGMTAVWDLPPDGSHRTLRCDGAAPLWMVGVDAGQRVSQAQVIPGSETTHVEPEVTRVAVTALWSAEDSDLAGWRADTELRQIGSQALVGDGVIIRPQSPCGLLRRRSSRGRRVSGNSG